MPAAAQHGPHIHNQCSPARTGGRAIISLAHSRVEYGQISTWRPPLLTAPLARKSFPDTCWEDILCASAPARRFARDGSISVAHRIPPPTLCLGGHRRVLGIASEDPTPLYVMRPPQATLCLSVTVAFDPRPRDTGGGGGIILFDIRRRAALPQLDQHDRSRSTDIVLIAAGRLIASMMLPSGRPRAPACALLAAVRRLCSTRVSGGSGSGGRHAQRQRLV